MDAGIQVLWQTGKNYYDAAKHTAQKIGSDNVYVKDFISEMDYAYAGSDIIISRAGAISVSEICIAAKPAIFVPSPNVAEDHQTKNAMTLVNQNAAMMVRDSESRIMLVNRLLELIKNTELQEQLKNNISKLKILNAAETIADEILQMVQID
jgi:UDP-N-acetylglucosamine--N-acetylmuramyl-(pentapeptide) pyrophosphoryl-undecaprenol N-acetylglucosamine transferase